MKGANLMRVISHSIQRPQELEVVIVGNRKNVTYRTGIKAETAVDENGETHEIWSAVEWSAQVQSTATIDDAFCKKLIAAETAKTEKKVRAKRDRLLEESDKEVLPDRLTKSSAQFKSWSEYRQALRDIPQQTGFPFVVVYPEKPN